MDVGDMSIERLKAEWDRHIEFLKERERYMNNWEKGFVLSIMLLRSKERTLTIHQSFKLREIHHRIEWKNV